VTTPFRLRPRGPHTTDTPERLRVEHLLAVWRLLLAVVSLTAVYVDPTEPSRFAAFCRGLLGGYVAFATVVWLLVRLRPAVVLRCTPLLLGVDILLPGALTALTTGAGSPFFALFTFAVISAAYRWGFVATLGTGLLTIVLVLVSGALVGEPTFPASPTDLNRLVIRCGYLLLLSIGIGIIAEREQTLRAETGTPEPLPWQGRSTDSVRPWAASPAKCWRPSA
jgi:hypothetical protein